jgi:hypothetical protein
MVEATDVSLADAYDVLVLFGGILGVVVGSYLQFEYSELSRKRAALNTVAVVGLQVLASMQDLMIHVGRNEDKLEPIVAETWEKNVPKTRQELNAILDSALEAFPLPMPAEATASVEEPYSLVVRMNLKDVRQIVEDINKSAEVIRSPASRDDKTVAAFLGRVQWFSTPENVKAVLVSIYGNMIDAVWSAAGKKLSVKEKAKHLQQFRLAVDEEYSDKVDVVKTYDEGIIHFANDLKSIK